MITRSELQSLRVGLPNLISSSGGIFLARSMYIHTILPPRAKTTDVAESIVYGYSLENRAYGQ